MSLKLPTSNTSETTDAPGKQGIRNSAMPALFFVLLLWSIKIVEVLLGSSFHYLGVYPQSFEGIHGIFTAPFIHGSFEHLASNSLPLLILITALFYGYPKSKLKTSVLIWLGSGIGTWLFAREAWHFGASGLTHGLFFFLLLASILRRDKRSIGLMMIAFFMYGGMLMSIFPQQENISFEYHLFGAISGLLAAVLFSKADPRLKEPSYEWENETHSNEDIPEKNDIIGDEWRSDYDSYQIPSTSSPPEPTDYNISTGTEHPKPTKYADAAREDERR